MTSMNLVLRPSTKEGHHPGSLSLRVIHNRQVKTVTLPGCRLYPEEWNKETQEESAVFGWFFLRFCCHVPQKTVSGRKIRVP